MSMQLELAILGAGAWGTALASSFAARHKVRLYARQTALAEQINLLHENRRYLPGCAVPQSVRASADLAEVLAGAELIVVATPLAGLRESAQQLSVLAPGVPVLTACKGLEVGTGLASHQIAAQVLTPGTPCGALTGPSFAQEVARGLPTAITLASSDLAFAERTALALHQPRLRLYANDDPVGCEVGGAVKNVIAIAAGIADGMGFGLNARAALMTRGLAEMARLGQALGGRRDTFQGLAGIGDLILTCTGELSRNRRVGLMLAQGKPLAHILSELGHVAEGVPTAREVAALASRLGVEMPITQAVDGILYHGLSAEDAVEVLLTREPRVE